MINRSPILERLKGWRRGPAVVGLVALAMLHIAAATHQFEHVDDHGVSVCEACSAYSQLEDTVIPGSPSVETAVEPQLLVATATTNARLETSVATYRSRAPPLS